jgi:hypothetical protein
VQRQAEPFDAAPAVILAAEEDCSLTSSCRNSKESGRLFPTEADCNDQLYL